MYIVNIVYNLEKEWYILIWVTKNLRFLKKDQAFYT